MWFPPSTLYRYFTRAKLMWGMEEIDSKKETDLLLKK